MGKIKLGKLEFVNTTAETTGFTGDPVGFVLRSGAVVTSSYVMKDNHGKNVGNHVNDCVAV